MAVAGELEDAARAVEPEAADGEGLEDAEEFYAHGEDFEALTKIEYPEWVDMLLAVSGIAGLQYRIAEERLKRAEEYYQNPHPEINNIVTHMHFEMLVACVIVLNSILIGWEASTQDGEPASFFSFMEHFFVVFFVSEWALRMVAFGWVWLFEFANFCDTLIVFGTGVLVKWLLEPLGFDIQVLRIFTVLRTLRLARIARAVRLQPTFKELWILIHGVITSARPLVWTWLISIVILYIFSVAATELIGRHSDFSDDEHVQEMFGDLVKSMFTMFQLMTLDIYCDTIIRPVMRKQGWLAIFFIFFIMVAVFVFWNLITAVIVENAFSMAKEDAAHRAKEAELVKKRELKELADLFLEIDKDGSGELTDTEFFSALRNKKVRQMMDLLGLKDSELKDVWYVLDDGDQLLTIKEFTNGIRRMKGEAKAKDIIDTVKRLRHTLSSQKELRQQVKQLGVTLTNLELDVRRICGDTGEVLGLFHEMFHRLDAYIESTDQEDRIQARQKERAAQLALLTKSDDEAGGQI